MFDFSGYCIRAFLNRSVKASWNNCVVLSQIPRVSSTVLALPHFDLLRFYVSPSASTQAMPPMYSFSIFFHPSSFCRSLLFAGSQNYLSHRDISEDEWLVKFKGCQGDTRIYSLKVTDTLVNCALMML